MKLCLQETEGPTPCFIVDAHGKVCSLDYCPAEKSVDLFGITPWNALHDYCVMSVRYGSQRVFTDGLGEFVRAIAENA